MFIPWLCWQSLVSWKIKLKCLIIKRLNLWFIGGFVGVYQYAKNGQLSSFCGVEDEPFVDPDNVSY